MIKFNIHFSIPSIIYGAHVSTTVIPILSEIIFSKDTPEEHKLTLVGFYLPYLLIPVILTLYMSFNPTPFGNAKSKSA